MSTMLETIFTIVERAPIIGRVTSSFYGLWLLLKKDLRLLQNLKRPIMILESSTKDMQLVAQLIRDAGFFRLEHPTTATQSTDRIRNHGAIVVGYTKGESHVGKIISAAQSKAIPVIVYAMPGEIQSTSEDLRAIQEYSYAEIANTPFRLVNLLFSIFSTHKYDR